MRKRLCWNVLEEKARRQAEQLGRECLMLRQRLNTLQASHSRIEQMLRDYSSAPAHTGPQQGMQDALNQRRFIDQLMALRERVERDCALHTQALAHSRQRWQAAQVQQQKMQALAEQTRARERAEQARLDQRRLDALAVQSFQRRQSPEP